MRVRVGEILCATEVVHVDLGLCTGHGASSSTPLPTILALHQQIIHLLDPLIVSGAEGVNAFVERAAEVLIGCYRSIPLRFGIFGDEERLEGTSVLDVREQEVQIDIAAAAKTQKRGHASFLTAQMRQVSKMLLAKGHDDHSEPEVLTDSVVFRCHVLIIK